MAISKDAIVHDLALIYAKEAFVSITNSDIFYKDDGSDKSDDEKEITLLYQKYQEATDALNTLIK